MRRCAQLIMGFCLLAAALSLRAQSDAEVQARKEALDVAGAFSNEGFKIRDGHWCGALKPHDHALVAVNLYSGNQYWFSAGATGPVKKIAVSVYDETGKPVTTETYSNGEKAAAGFSPASSGQYYVAVDLLEGEPGTFCLVYSYK